MGRTHLRRRLALAAVTVTTALAGWAFVAGDAGGGTPSPVVWRDHVVEPPTSTAP